MRASDHLFDFGRPVAYYPGLVKHLGSVNAVLLFCQFFYWSDKTENELGVYKSVEAIEKETGLSYREQATARKQLIAKGVLIETHKRLEHRIYYRIDRDQLDALLSLADCETCNSPNADCAVGERTKAHFVHTENTTETTSEIKTNVAEVFDHWRVVMSSPRSKMDAKRQKVIKGALKNYTVDDLKAAIDGCKASPFHMGDNERREKYNSIELILRNAEKIEGFMAKAARPPVAPKRSSITQDFKSKTYEGTPDDQLADFLH